MITTASLKIGQETVAFNFSGVGDSTKNGYFTFLLGPNGTYKSRILSTIVYRYKRDFSSRYKGRTSKNAQSYFEGKIDFTGVSRVIALASSPYDKFPAGTLNTDKHEVRNTWDFKDAYYYLGLRSKSGQGLRNNKDRVLGIISASFAREYKDGNPVLDCFRKLNLKSHILVEWVEGDGRSFFERSKSPSTTRTRAAMYESGRKKKDSGSFLVNLNEFDSKIELVDLIERERDGQIIIKNLFIAKEGEDVEFNLLESSSGELSLLMHGLGLVYCLTNNSVVLIDEPEISLHPNWQIEYLDYISEVALKYFKGCHFIVGTHSPHIISTASNKRTTILGLKRDQKGAVSVSPIEYSPEGWSVENILLDVFGIQTVRNSYFEDLISKALMAFENPKYERRRQVLELALREFRKYRLSSSDPLLFLINDIEGLLKSDKL